MNYAPETVVARGEPLAEEHVRTALAILSGWSAQPFLPEQEAAWRVALRGYRQGEFGPAMAAWQRSARGRFRPRPADLAPFLHRPPARGSAEETAQRLAELRSIPRMDPGEQASYVDACRIALRRTPDAAEPVERHSRAYAWETGCECAKCIFLRIDQRERERRELDRDTEDRRQQWSTCQITTNPTKGEPCIP